jgi:K+-transporting ATPase ATPase C chain
MGPVLFFLGIVLVTGVIYPLAMTGISKVVFPYKANGSLVVKDERVVGSELIAQSFKDPKYFWSRPSASNYNAVPSGASNLPPWSPKFPKKQADTTSASGLDPHLPLELAREQIVRVASARGKTPEQIEAVISRSKKPYLNVVMTNLELDAL